VCAGPPPSTATRPAAMEVSSVEFGHHAAAASKCFDDDGRLKRTGKGDLISLMEKSVSRL
jgi:hypothetical protein